MFGSWFKGIQPTVGGKIWGQCECPDRLETESGWEVRIGYQLQGTPPSDPLPSPPKGCTASHSSISGGPSVQICEPLRDFSHGNHCSHDAQNDVEDGCGLGQKGRQHFVGPHSLLSLEDSIYPRLLGVGKDVLACLHWGEGIGVQLLLGIDLKHVLPTRNLPLHKYLRLCKINGISSHNALQA